MRIDSANFISLMAPSARRGCTAFVRGAPRTEAARHAAHPLIRTALAGFVAFAVAAVASAGSLPGATSRHGASGVPAPSSPSRAGPARKRATRGCLADGSGYLRARIQGAVNLDIDWPNVRLACEGSARSRGRGLRLSFAGPLPRHGRLRMIFGVAAVRAGHPGRELPTSVTVIFEGKRRLYATLGRNKCTVDRLRQRLVARHGRIDIYRVAARGFCFDPLTDLIHDDRIVMSRFDFAGRLVFASPPS